MVTRVNPTNRAHASQIQNIKNDLANMVPGLLQDITRPAQALIKRISSRERDANAARFALGSLLLKGKEQTPAGEFTNWFVETLLLEPKTAQNFMQMSEAFGSSSNAFIGLKTTQIYALSRGPDDVRKQALLAAQDGSLTRELASKLLLGSNQPTRRITTSDHVSRAIQIVALLDTDVRTEFLKLLADVSPEEIRKAFTKSGVIRKPPPLIEGEAV